MLQYIYIGGKYMSFINEFSIQKQHINLSHDAWTKIEDDIFNFRSDGNTITLSGFLNQVFINYYPFSNATISQRKIGLFAHYEKSLTKELKGYTPKQQSDIIESIVEHEIKLITATVKANTKGIGKKFRLSNEVFNILAESPDYRYYENHVGSYLKAIFEDYAKLDYYKREHIYFLHVSSKIESSILKNEALILTSTNQKKYKFKPYKIVQDKSSLFNYVVGLSLNTVKTLNNIITFRLSRILDVKTYYARSGKMSKEEKLIIEDALRESGPQFLSGHSEEIIIEFTQNGLRSYHNQIHLRPKYSKILDNGHYVFNCPKIQALYYFFKFGEDVKVIHPDSLKNTFIHRYKSAINNYL